MYVPNYGVTGVGRRAYGTSYDIAGTNGGSILSSGFKRDRINNPDIKWETTTQYNVGLDWAMFNNRFFGNLDLYYKKTSDILVRMIGIGAMGEGSSQWINAGEMENKGVEAQHRLPQHHIGRLPLKSRATSLPIATKSPTYPPP